MLVFQYHVSAVVRYTGITVHLLKKKMSESQCISNVPKLEFIIPSQYAFIKTVIKEHIKTDSFISFWILSILLLIYRKKENLFKSFYLGDIFIFCEIKIVWNVNNIICIYLIDITLRIVSNYCFLIFICYTNIKHFKSLLGFSSHSFFFPHITTQIASRTWISL